MAYVSLLFSLILFISPIYLLIYATLTDDRRYKEHIERERKDKERLDKVYEIYHELYLDHWLECHNSVNYDPYESYKRLWKRACDIYDSQVKSSHSI